LGAAISRELADMGYHVVIVYRTAEQAAHALVATIQQSGGQASCLPAELGTRDGVEALADGLDVLTAGLGPVRLLVNNAALFYPTPVTVATDTAHRGPSWQALESLLHVNLLAPLWLSSRMGGTMSHGGQIINLCDLWGRRPLRHHTAYSVSKAGLIMATQGLARDLAPRVRVNGIAPGVILPPADPAALAAYHAALQRTPLAHAAGESAVLAALRYLLRADYVTGSVLDVDGGRALELS
jgi:pteridine reductase